MSDKELLSKIDQLEEMLAEADCPECDGSGYTIQSTEPPYSTKVCKWCTMRRNLLEETYSDETHMKEFTYLLYVMFMMVLLFGGCGYAVFVLGHSGWWFLLATILASCCYTPERWIHGKVPKEE